MDEGPEKCVQCGYGAGTSARGLVRVIDELGAAVMCPLCAIQLLAAADRGQIELTLVLGRSPAGSVHPRGAD